MVRRMAVPRDSSRAGSLKEALATANMKENTANTNVKLT